MSDANYDTYVVRHAHGTAVAQLKREGCLALPIPTTSDLLVALARAGFPMPRERALRLALACGLPLADAPAETHGRRPRRSY